MTSRLILCSVLLLAAGCQSTPKMASVSDPDPAPTAGTVSKVLALWSDAVLRNGDVPVAQGFTARVYLINPGTTEPTAAEGTFKFFAFEENSSLAPATEPVKPTYEWEFRSADAQPRLSKDPLGWGYSFWLPCGSPQNSDRRFSVIARFTPGDGKPLASETTLVHLPTLGDSKVRGVTYRYEKTLNSDVSGAAEHVIARLDGIASLAEDE